MQLCVYCFHGLGSEDVVDRHIPLLIFANKMDVHDSISAIEVSNFNCNAIPAIATTSNKGGGIGRIEQERIPTFRARHDHTKFKKLRQPF